MVSKEHFAAKSLGVAARTVGGSAYILCERERRLFQLNQTGTYIWEHINGANTISDIARMCHSEFNEDIEDATVQVLEFVELLRSMNLVECAYSPFSGMMAYG